MRFNIKVLKSIISVTLATAIATSCIIVPVEAFRAPEESSRKFIDKVAALNLKVDNYESSLMNAWDKIAGDFLHQTGNASRQHAKKVENMEKILRYMSGKLDHLMDRECGASPINKCLNDLRYDDLYVYDESSIDKIDSMLDSLETYITLLVNKVDGLSLDIDKDKVFYTEKSKIINLDENEDNGIKKELKYTQMKKFFGDTANLLTNKIGDVYKFVENDMNEKFKNTIENIPIENTLDLTNLQRKLEEYETIRSDFEDVIHLLRIKGRCPNYLKRAIRNLTGNGNSTAIPSAKNSEFIKNAQSMQNAIGLIDNAIDQMKKFMASKIAKNKEIEINNISSIMNTCIDEMAKLEHIEKSEQFAASEELKESNEKFTGAFLKLKSLAELTDDAGKQLLKEFRDMYTELVDLYVFYDANKEPAAFSAEVQNKSQQVRGKLSEILEKCKEIQQ